MTAPKIVLLLLPALLLLAHYFSVCEAQAGFNLNRKSKSYDDYGYEDEETNLICTKYAPQECNPAFNPKCPTTEKCIRQPGLEPSCMTTWMNTTEEGVKILAQGCWLHQKNDECRQSRCISRKANIHSKPYSMKTYFCCCTGEFCNDDVFFEPLPPTPAPPATTEVPRMVKPVEPWVAFLSIFVPIMAIALVIFFAYWYYRRYQLCEYLKKQGDPDGRRIEIPNASEEPLLPIQLREEDIVARGRFGKVYRAQMGDEVVAVKKFPRVDVDSWVQEQEIYAVSGMKKHPAILNFIAAEKRGNGLDEEYWLITAYHPNGSLSDYLKHHTVTVDQALVIAITMLNGLGFLHEEHVERGEIIKSTIVHRDFKSRNVLLKKDLTACVADFGLALKCEHGQTREDTHGQVGTRRYMAPEVLEGATEFSAIAFRQIDVYASGLVLWEILQRCIFCEGERVVEYKLPFEEEIGQHPSLQQMQETVVNNKQRPLVKDSWRRDKRCAVMCHAMTELWDAEPEARISAGVALERLSGLIPNSGSLTNPPDVASCHNLTVAPPLGRGSVATQEQNMELSPLMSAASPETIV